MDCTEGGRISRIENYKKAEDIFNRVLKNKKDVIASLPSQSEGDPRTSPRFARGKRAGLAPGAKFIPAGRDGLDFRYRKPKIASPTPTGAGLAMTDSNFFSTLLRKELPCRFIPQR
jgi:hypothetical protein